MDPETKAKHLMHQYHNIIPGAVYNRELLIKQCCLIAIDEILNSGQTDDLMFNTYWNEVKRIINDKY